MPLRGWTQWDWEMHSAEVSTSVKSRGRWQWICVRAPHRRTQLPAASLAVLVQVIFFIPGNMVASIGCIQENEGVKTQPQSWKPPKLPALLTHWLPWNPISLSLSFFQLGLQEKLNHQGLSQPSLLTRPFWRTCSLWQLCSGHCYHHNGDWQFL